MRVVASSTTRLPIISWWLIWNAATQQSNGAMQQPQPPPNQRQTANNGNPSRRETLGLIFGGAGLATSSLLRPAVAFDNGVPEMAQFTNWTKYPETQPTSIGLQDNGKLAICDDAPNCFSTSGDDESYLLMPWVPQKDGSDAMADILETIKAYPPGQAKVDRGGFSIITSRPDYLYVQFESKKHGFIDDVEFAINTSGGGGAKKAVQVVQVRSSSRIGFLDLGVNGKRLNYISARLREKGWIASAITPEDYPDYFPMIPFSFDDYIRSVLSPEDCPVPAKPLECKGPF